MITTKRFFFSLMLIALQVGKIYSQDVDPFTGRFSYAVPLLTVPSPDGNGIPVSAVYSAGAGVNQPASDVGLGWTLLAGGAVTRFVSGVPDDCNGTSYADITKKSFIPHYGSMHLVQYNNALIDIYSSTYKKDASSFYFPDYDNYSVTGPGLSGSMQPYLFEYGTINKDQYGFFHYYHNGTAAKKPQFVINGDFSGNLYSRHIPEAGIQDSLFLPGNTVAFTNPATQQTSTSELAFEGGNTGEGYNNENYAEDQNKNRLITGKYVEYFTNAEINAGTVTGFVDFRTTHTRANDEFPSDGIGAFRITTENGVTYHYSLPVYIKNTVNGKYPLNNDYSVQIYDNNITNTPSTSGNGKMIADNDNDGIIIEDKEDFQYAYSWLLTAVTGTDYDDVNANGMADDGDKGYWVSYDWKKWTGSFKARTPFYGFNYAFEPDEDDDEYHFPVNTAKKISGKWGTFSTAEQEIYYLNGIKTASHTAVFVRDIRNDEHSTTENYDRDFYREYNLNSTPQTSACRTGVLYDDGGPNGNYSSPYNTSFQTLTIAPTGADKVQIHFSLLDLANAPDYIYIYDGTNTTGTLLATLSHSTAFSATGLTYISTSNAITIKMQIGSTGTTSHQGFVMEWKAVSATENLKMIPQLKLSRIVLFRNQDLSTLPSATAITTSGTLWDLSSTQTSGYLYNEQWYQTNKTDIEKYSLKTIEFNQDYSLARKYHNNIHVSCENSYKNHSPHEVINKTAVASGKYDESGKLTLNEITSYESGHTKLIPSYLFEYYKNVVTANPDYNPLAVDYWGYYKKDITAKAYSSYTTSSSQKYVSAWSLRRITTPLGGTLDIEYESNTYQKVLSEDNTAKGATRIYPMENFVFAPDASYPNSNCFDSATPSWNFTLEDDVKDFWSMLSQPPAEMKKLIVIPNGKGMSQHYSVSSTDFSVSVSSKKATLSSPEYRYSCDANYNYTQNNLYYAYFSGDINCSEASYSGNGFISFELPAGYTVYGGGIRVKSITTRNCSEDAYTQTYTYSGGVAASEPDRFDIPKRRMSQSTCTGDVDATIDKNDPDRWYYGSLLAYNADRHKMPPMVGYTNVTVQNTGQINVPNGAVTYTFKTDDTGIDNFQTGVSAPPLSGVDCAGCKNISCNNDYTCYNQDLCCYYDNDNNLHYAPKNWYSNHCKRIDEVITVTDKFSSYWGKLLETKVADKNNNIISMTQNTYSNLRQGMITENLSSFLRAEGLGGGGSGIVPSPFDCNSISYYNVLILREYPTVLTKQTVYSGGVKTITEYLKFDEVTGIPTEIKTTDMNNMAHIVTSVPAFKKYPAMGSKAVSYANKNLLASSYSTKSYPYAVSAFNAYNIQTWKNNYTVRKYNTTSGEYEHSAVTNSFWVSDKSYTWTGPLEQHGLFDASQYVEFNAASPDGKWRFTGETTLIDKNGHALETRAFNNRYAAVKYGYGDLYPVASCNTNYTSFTYTGFEDKSNVGTGGSPVYYFSAEVSGGELQFAATSSIKAHTGNYVARIQSGAGKGPEYKVRYVTTGNNQNLQRGKTYRASVWVHNSSPASAKLVMHLTGSLSDGTVINDLKEIRKDNTGNVTTGDWTLMNLDIDVPENYVSTGGQHNDLRIYLENPTGTTAPAYFDDFRFHPVDAALAASVYDVKTGNVTAVLDNNNFATVTVYDEAGRVTEVWTETEHKGLVKIKSNSYGYAR